jgi:hypothetical protein
MTVFGGWGVGVGVGVVGVVGVEAVPPEPPEHDTVNSKARVTPGRRFTRDSGSGGGKRMR